MKSKKLGIVFLLLVLLLPIVYSDMFIPTEGRYISTGQNADYFYTKIHTPFNDEYIGISKNNQGEVHIGDKDSMFGKMWLVPVFKLGGNWWLCPIRNMDTVNSVDNLGDGWEFSVSDSAVTCYNYMNTASMNTANLDVTASFITTDGRTKINVDTSINGVSPSDTGFGFLFIPTDLSKFRYVNIGGDDYDLDGVENGVPPIRQFTLKNQFKKSIGHYFDWNDMFDTGNEFAEVISTPVGKGLLIGTYGYGSTNFISIDPLYIVDYSPEPSEHLIGGMVNLYDDTQFDSHPDITIGISDDLDSTSYDTVDNPIIEVINIGNLIDELEFDTGHGQTPTSLKVADSVGGAVFAVFYEGVQSDGFVSTYEVYDNGTITFVIDNFEFDTAVSITPVALKVTDNIFIVAYEGGSTAGTAKTIEIFDNGTINGVLDTFEAEPTDMTEPNMFWLREDENILVLTSSQSATDGIISTGNISDNGSITRLDRYIFNETQADEIDSINISRNIILLSYLSDVGSKLETFYILDNGSVNHSIDTEIYDAGDGTESHIVDIGNDIFAIVYKGTNSVGTIVTYQVTTDGQISSVIDSQIFEVEGGVSGFVDPFSLEISDDIIALVSRHGDDDSGQLDLWRIYENGTILDQELDNITYDPIQTYQQEISYFKDDIYIITYQGDGLDGYIRTVEIIIDELAEGKAINGKWNQTYDSLFSWFLRVKKTTSGTGNITIHPYINDTNINTTLIVVDSLVGTGWFNINISNLIEYQDNLGLNHSSIRFYTTSEHNFSEMRLRKEFNDTSSPIITDCQVNDTLLEENDIVRLQCNVTDNIDVDNVNGTLDGISNQFIKEGDIYYYDWECERDDYGLHNWSLVEAWDILGNYNYSEPNIMINCSILFHPPNVSIINPSENESLFQPYTITYEIFDYDDDTLNGTLYLDGTSLDSNLTENGSYYWDIFIEEGDYTLLLEVCELDFPYYCSDDSVSFTVLDYCYEDIILVRTELESCNPETLVYNVSYSYTDNNYDTCCIVTNLSSDCNILNETLYPANYTLEYCAVFDCVYDETPFLKLFDDKIPLLCTYNFNGTYEFITYVKAEGELIQTNPERQLIDLYGEYNSFRGEDGIVNLYYTSDNLRPDREITVIVEGQQGLFYEDFNVTPTYQEIYQAQDRMFWTMDNIGWILGGIIFLLIIGTIAVFLVKRFNVEIFK